MNKAALSAIITVLVLTMSLTCGAGVPGSVETLPGAAPVSAQVTVRGRGFLPGRNVNLRLVGTGVDELLSTVSIGSAGELLTQVTLPEVPADTYQVEVHGLTSGLLAATDQVVMAPPTVTLTPDAGVPGTLVQVDVGSVSPGSMEILYHGVPVLGPTAHSGGPFSSQFAVPAAPLGEVVPVEAIARVGTLVSATGATTFASIEPDITDLRMLTIEGPSEMLRGGDKFMVTGQLQFPPNTVISDYQFTLVWITTDGTMYPANPQPVLVADDGTFEVGGVAPSLASGYPRNFAGVTVGDGFGIVYLNPEAKTSGLLGQTPVDYELLDVQPITVHVTDVAGTTPLGGSVVIVYSNAFLVPADDNWNDDDPPARAVGTATQSTWPAIFAPLNQFQAAFNAAMNTDLVQTGCPIALHVGQTDANGDFTFNVQPYINELLDKSARAVSDLDINTNVHGPGNATFHILTNAIQLGHALVNDSGDCTARRFDFQYDYVGGQWKQRDGPEGEFEEEFDPNQPIDVPLPVCSGNVTFTGEPYIPGLPTIHYNIGSQVVTQIAGLRGFPDTNGAALVVQEVPQLRLPHLDILFGAPTNVHLFFGSQDQGEMLPQEALCGGDGIEYVIDLPGLETLPAQIIEATIVGEFQGATMELPLQLQIQAGPTWINNAQDYVTRSIFWKPGDVTLFGEEPVRSQDASINNVPQDVGNLNNDNLTGGTVRQKITPGGSTRYRTGLADATAANVDGSDVNDTSSATSGQSSEIGEDQEHVIADSGKIPLFRYVWGIWPVADITVGADFWFRVLYYYYGHMAFVASQVQVDLESAATMTAGLDLWFDLSVIFDVVSMTAFALPSIELGMPLVIEDNQIDTDASSPCFGFLLDVAYEVSVGWCPVCLTAGGEENILDEREPSGCQIPGSKMIFSKAIPAIPAVDRTAIAVDGLGESMIVWGDGSGDLMYQTFQQGVPGALQALAAGIGSMAPDVAYLNANQAVMAWARSSLDDATFLALKDPFAATPYQQIVFSLWDGSTWSTPTPLTLPTSGDGGVVLAACPAQDSNCPAGGEVLAVWVHDEAGDISQHNTRLYYATYNGFIWTTPTAVDPLSTAKDMQPTAAYANGEPVVAWTRNPGVSRGPGAPQLDLNQRHIAYRFLNQPSGAQPAVGLSSAVGSPSLTGYSDGSLALAYSVATEPDAFIGTRRSLHTAHGHSCALGICSWSESERLDSDGRRIFVEKPKIVVTGDDWATVVFRQLGIEWALPGEAPGVLASTGDLAEITFNFDTLVTDAMPLTVDGAINWKVDAAFDPITNAMMFTAVQGPALGMKVLAGMEQPADKAWGITTTKLGGSSVSLIQQPMMPDFHLLGAQPSQPWIPAAGSIEITVQLRNNGQPWSEPQDLELATYWDGPPGLGTLERLIEIVSLPSGSATDTQFSVQLPPSFNEDDLHDLHIVVNPEGSLAESETGNNSVVVPLGALPVPQNLTATGDTNSGIIIINWDALSDPRVTGYRVYRVNPDGSVLAVGSSDVAGFADLSAYRDHPYEYYVVSHSARMMESLPSESVVAMTFGEVVFRGGFEGATP